MNFLEYFHEFSLKKKIRENIRELNGLLGIEGLEPSRFLKSTDFPLTPNFIGVGIDM